MGFLTHMRPKRTAGGGSGHATTIQSFPTPVRRPLSFVRLVARNTAVRSNRATDMNRMISASIAILASFHCCFGQTDTNMLAASAWSEPARDNIWPLRGRLVVYDAVPDKGDDTMWPQARVYLELQHVPEVPFAAKKPIAVFVPAYSGLRCEMRDERGVAIPSVLMAKSGRIEPPVMLLLPPDSTLRLRVDDGIRTQDPSGLLVSVPGGDWNIKPQATNEYHLSGTFSPSGEVPVNVLNRVRGIDWNKKLGDTNEYHPPSTLSPPGESVRTEEYHLWRGTLRIPSVRIPAERIRKR